eukprot:3756398-Amphidinium_carterae.1
MSAFASADIATSGHGDPISRLISQHKKVYHSISSFPNLVPSPILLLCGKSSERCLSTAAIAGIAYCSSICKGARRKGLRGINSGRLRNHALLASCLPGSTTSLGCLWQQQGA